MDKFEGQFPNYFSNVTKSVKYSGTAVAKEILPSSASFLETNDEVVRLAIDSLKNIPKAIKDLKEATSKLPGIKQAQEVMGNMKSDLKTGKFYNKDRKAANEPSGFGGFDDMGLEGFGDAFGSSVGSSMSSAVDRAQSSFAEVQSQSTTAITSSMDTGFSVTGSIMSNNHAQSMKAGEETFNAINKIVSFNNEGMKPFIDRSLQYYDEQITLSKQMVALLQEDVEHKRNMYKANQQQQYQESDIEKIFDAEGFLDIKAYSKIVKDNLKNVFAEATGNDFDTLKMMMGMNGKSNFVTSPISAMMEAGMKKLIPETLKQTSMALDDTLKNFSSALIAKINDIAIEDNDEYTGDSKIGELFHNLKKNAAKVFQVRADKASINTKMYNKGPVPFDGITRKSIIEVIPSLLSKINTGIHGLNEDLVFDYENSRFTTNSEMNAEFRKMDRNIAIDSMSGLDTVFEKYLEDSPVLSSRKLEDLKLGFEDLKYALASTGVKFSDSEENWQMISDLMSSSQFGAHSPDMLEDLRKVLDKDTHQAKMSIGRGQASYVSDYNRQIAKMNETSQTSGLAMSQNLDSINHLTMTPEQYYEIIKRENANIDEERLKRELVKEQNQKFRSTRKIEGIEAEISETKSSKLSKVKSTTSLLTDIKRILLEGIVVYTKGSSKLKERKFATSELKRIEKHEAEQQKIKDKIAEDKHKAKMARRRDIKKTNKEKSKDNAEHAHRTDSIDAALDPSNLRSRETKKSLVEREGTFLNKLLAVPMAKLNDGMDKVNTSLKKFLFGSGDEENPTVFEKGFKWLGKKWDTMVTSIVKFFENEDSWLNRTKKKAQDWMSEKVFDRIKNWWSKEDGAKSKIMSFLKGTDDKPGMLPTLQNWGRSFSMGATNFIFGKDAATVGADGKLKFDLKGSSSKDGVIGETFGALKGIGSSIRDVIFGKDSKFDKDGKFAGLGSSLKEAFPSMAKGAGVGLVASLFLPGGPLLGMLVGSAAGFAQRSGGLGDFLFGKEGKDGKKILGLHFNKQMKQEFKDNRGGFNMGMGAGVGMLASIFLPGGPLLGAAIGSFAGLVKSSDTLKDQLFGEQSKFAQIFGKDFKEKFGQRMPAVKAGVGLGAIASLFLPGGPIIGALMGGMIGLVKDSKTFQKLLWGDNLQSRGILGGSIDFIKSKFLLPITKVFAKGGGKFAKFLQKRIVNRAAFVMDVMMADVKHYTTKLYKGVTGWFFNRTKGFLSTTLGKIFSPFLKLGKGLIGGSLKLVGKAVSAPFAGAEKLAERRLRTIAKRDSESATRIAERRDKLDKATDKADKAIQKVFGNIVKYTEDEQARLKKQKQEFTQYHNIRVTVEKEINKISKETLKTHIRYQELEQEKVKINEELVANLKKYKGDKEGQAIVHMYHNEAMQKIKKEQKNIEGQVKFDTANQMGKEFLSDDKDPMKFTKRGTKSKWYTINKNTVLDMEKGGADAGHAVLEGIIKGMDDARKGVDDSVELHADSTIQKFREEFGINSPAKEMIPIGEGIIEGIMLGMENKLQTLYGFINERVVEPVKEKLAPLTGASKITSSSNPSDADNSHDSKLGESHQDNVIEKEKQAQATALQNMAKHTEETANNTKGLSLLKMGKKGFNALKAILLGAIPFITKVIGFGKKVWGVMKAVPTVIATVKKGFTAIKTFGKAVLGVIPKALKFGRAVLTALRALPAAIAAKGWKDGIMDTIDPTGKGRKKRAAKKEAKVQTKANKEANQNYKDMTPEERKALRDDRLARGETIQEQAKRLKLERDEAKPKGAKGLLDKLKGGAKGSKGGLKNGLKALGKGALKGAKGIPVAGQVLAAGLAAFDGVSGWKNAGENFGLEEGQEATFGQKLSSATGSALSGLTFGLVDEAWLSKGIHGLGSGAKELGGKALSWGKEAGGKALDWGKDAAKSAWEGTKKLAGSTKDFIVGAGTKVKEMATGIIEFRDKIGAGIKDAFGKAKDLVVDTAGKIKDTVADAWKGAKDLAGTIGDKISDGVNKVKDKVVDVATGVKDAASNVKDKATDAAKAVGNFFGFGGTEINPITSGFGERISPFTGKKVFHPGTDIAMKEDQPVTAVSSGTVIGTGKNKTLGNYIELQADDGTKHKYGHLNTLNVKKGDILMKGAKLGGAGSTGQSTGTHLHFEVTRDGKFVNSDSYMKNAMGGSEIKLESPISSMSSNVEAMTSVAATSLMNMLESVTQMASSISDVIPEVVTGVGSQLASTVDDANVSTGITTNTSRTVRTIKSNNKKTTSFKSKIKKGFNKVKKFFGFGGTELAMGGPDPGKDAVMADAGSGTAASTTTATSAYAIPVNTTNNRITSKFGPRPNPFGNGPTETHKGIDYAPYSRKAGEPIMSIADGTVSTAKFIKGYGNVIYVDHGNGLQSRYAHLLDGGILVKSGDKVTKGQIIGKMGSTGRSTGNHLHFEIRKNNDPIDPEAFLSSNGATAGAGTMGASSGTTDGAASASSDGDPFTRFLTETGNLLNAAIFGTAYTPGGSSSSTSGGDGSSSGGGNLKSNGPIVGALARKYETGNRGPGMVSSGKGDHGGISYGSYQIPSYSTAPTSSGGQLPKFVDFLAKKNPEMAAKLKAAYPVNSPAFKSAWEELGNTKTEEFANIQHEYQELGNYSTARNKWKSNLGLDIDTKSVALQAAGFSTAIQHGGGGASKVFKNAGINGNMDTKTAIERIYNERAKVGTYFPSSPSLHKGLISRFNREKADALAMYAEYGEKSTGGTELAMGGPAEPIKYSGLVKSPSLAKKQKQQVKEAELLKPAYDTNIESMTNEMDTVMSATSLSSKGGLNVPFEKILQILSKIYKNTASIVSDGIEVKNIADAKLDPNSNPNTVVVKQENSKNTKETVKLSDRNIFLGSNKSEELQPNTSFMNKIAQIASGKM